jgi:hypothetical protein
VLLQAGSRAYEGHFPTDNVDQLREFIEAGQPEESAHPRNPPIAVHPALFVEETVGLHDHASELPDEEPPTVATDAILPEEDWPAILQPDQQPDDRERGRKQQQENPCRDPITGVLDGQLPAPGRHGKDSSN